MKEIAVPTNEDRDWITQYFDEMNLLPSEKKQRIDLARKFYDRAHDWLCGVLEDIKSGRFLHEKADGDYVDDLIAMYIAMVEIADKSAMYDTEVNAKAMRFATQVQQTNRNEATSIMSEDSAYTSNVLFGTGIQEELFPRYLEYDFGGDEWGDYRAEQIARFETNWIYNYLAHKKRVADGQLTHTWETMRDEKVRGSHALADMQTKMINEPFVVGGYFLLFPTDDSMGAPASETCGCRCLEI